MVVKKAVDRSRTRVSRKPVVMEVRGGNDNLEGNWCQSFGVKIKSLILQATTL